MGPTSLARLCLPCLCLSPSLTFPRLCLSLSLPVAIHLSPCFLSESRTSYLAQVGLKFTLQPRWPGTRSSGLRHPGARMTGTPFCLVQVIQGWSLREATPELSFFPHKGAFCSGDPLLGRPIQQTEAATGWGSRSWLSWAGSQFLELYGCLGTNISLYCPVSQDSQETGGRRELWLDFSALRS